MRFFIVPNYGKKETRNILDELLRLLEQGGDEYLVFPLGRQLLESGGEQLDSQLTEAQQDFLSGCDMVLSIGGDGTIIHCARFASAGNRPIVGINAGHLGFLAQIEREHLSRYLEQLRQRHYHVTVRNALAATLDGEERPELDFALNDIVLTKTPEKNIACFEMRCNGRKIDAYRADGVIFSTATGSTAYALSAGGPVLDPQLKATVMVPICPHAISIRPMVFAAENHLTISSPDSSLAIIADGRDRITVPPGCVIDIQQSRYQARFVDFHDQEFFEILTAKIKQRG